ncbi:PH domain-containing protein [Streptomyces sp. NPDC006879]|uniref:PH domain-containing protein n=1 Tax=Streptomyces sp. NPDC006879 TaxID=3364767 RepID=UPI0036812E99
MDTGTAAEMGRDPHGSAGGPGGEGGPIAERPGEPSWRGVQGGLLRMRRLLIVIWLGGLTVLTGMLSGFLLGPGWALVALVPLAFASWAWGLAARNWRSWGYAERSDDLLIRRGVMWREETVVPYGRMQLVEVTSGPVERRFGLATVQLHTAAAATDATIPGLLPMEAERLRDRLSELGEARSAGL